MRIATLLIGAAAGYVLGTRAGRERYEQIVDASQNAWESDQVQGAVERISRFIDDKRSK